MHAPGFLKIIVVSAFVLTTFLIAPAQYRFDSWTTVSGLPQNSVQDILQSQDGYIWFTTNGGIVRFDGVRFKVFNKSNTEGLRDSRFTMTLEDGSGRLWFLTEENTIVRYENGNFSTLTSPNASPGKIVYRFYKDQNGILTFTTEEGHFRYQDGMFKKFEIATSQLKSYICFIDSEGGIWLTENPNSKSEKQNIRRVLGDQVTYFDFETTSESIPPFIYEDRFKNFWVSIAARSLNRIYNGKTQMIPIDVGFYTDFLEDTEGNLWLGQKGGLFMLEADEVGKENLEISKIRKIPQKGEIWNEIKSLALDREKGIWVGTYKSGLHHLTPQTIRVYSKTDWGTEAENVYPIFEDSQSNVWVGVWTATLIKYDRDNNYQVFLNGPFDGSLSSFFEDSNKRIWIGGRKKVGYFENNEFAVFDKFDDWGELFINAIAEDKDGSIWFGSAAKLVRYAKDQIKVFTPADGLPDKFITALLKTKDGKFWVGTKRGLALYENEKFQAFTDQDGLNFEYVRSLYEDTDGTLWIGTYDTGIIRYKAGKFTRISEKDGMFNGNVFCILEDDNGWFWINSNQGIYRVKKQQLNDFADGKIKNVDSIGYNKNDGLLNTEGNGGYQPAGIRRRNGELWFPTQQGVAVIEPNKISINHLPPPVYLEEILIDYKNIGKYGDELEIQPSQDNLEIHYTGLSLVNSPLVTFRYRLEGLEEEWNEIGTRRFALYNNLPPGEYTFRVLAANRDAVWNMEGASIKIIKLPFFYQTWWFLVLLVMVAAAIIWLIFYNRFSHLRNIADTTQKFSRRLIESQEAERKRIAFELHDGIGQSLAIISNLAAMGKKRKDDPQFVFNEFEEISLSANGALDEVHEITSNLHPYNLERMGLTKALKSMFTKVSGVMKLDYEMDTIDDIFPKHSEINIYRIMQESLNNIIKHSEASAAAITIKAREKEVVITITDNGRGFDPNVAKGNGLGLVGLNERTNLIGGKLRIKSGDGKGTEITINLPIVRLN